MVSSSISTFLCFSNPNVSLHLTPTFFWLIENTFAHFKGYWENEATLLWSLRNFLFHTIQVSPPPENLLFLECASKLKNKNSFVYFQRCNSSQADQACHNLLAPNVCCSRMLRAGTFFPLLVPKQNSLKITISSYRIVSIVSLPQQTKTFLLKSETRIPFIWIIHLFKGSSQHNGPEWRVFTSRRLRLEKEVVDF